MSVNASKARSVQSDVFTVRSRFGSHQSPSSGTFVRCCVSSVTRIRASYQ